MMKGLKQSSSIMIRVLIKNPSIDLIHAAKIAIKETLGGN